MMQPRIVVPNMLHDAATHCEALAMDHRTWTHSLGAKIELQRLGALISLACLELLSQV